MVIEEGLSNQDHRAQHAADMELLNATRDYTDVLKRRADLIHAISDHVTENALGSEQLEALAAIVWPAIHPLPIDPTLTPTQLPSSGMLVAASLINTGAQFVQVLLDTYAKVPGVQVGTDLTRQIEEWKSEVHAWRFNAGLETDVSQS